MKPNWNFWGDGDTKQKPFRWGSMDIFLELHNPFCHGKSRGGGGDVVVQFILV